jgi:hypothetical protein
VLSTECSPEMMDGPAAIKKDQEIGATAGVEAGAARGIRAGDGGGKEHGRGEQDVAAQHEPLQGGAVLAPRQPARSPLSPAARSDRLWCTRPRRRIRRRSGTALGSCALRGEWLETQRRGGVVPPDTTLTRKSRPGRPMRRPFPVPERSGAVPRRTNRRKDTLHGDA